MSKRKLRASIVSVALIASLCAPAVWALPRDQENSSWVGLGSWLSDLWAELSERFFAPSEDLQPVYAKDGDESGPMIIPNG